MGSVDRAGANLIFGVVNDDRMQGEVKITVIATGFGRNRKAGLKAASSSTATENTTIEYTKPKPEPARPSLTEDEDLNIPAFLRNRI